MATKRRCQPRQRAKSEVLKGVDDYLDLAVYDAVIVWGPLEGPWNAYVLIDRIKWYIRKGAESAADSMELSKAADSSVVELRENRELPWRKSVRTLVKNAMDRYAKACRYRGWFFDVDLGDSFGGVAWELVRGIGALCKQDVMDFADDQYRSGADQDRRWDFPMYLGNLGGVPHAAGVS